MAWALNDYKNQIRRLESSKPLIDAVLGLDHVRDVYYVDVTNRGETGDFEVQIHLIDTTEPKLELFRPRYNGYFDEELVSRIPTADGVTKRVKLAPIEHGHVVVSANLRFYIMASKGMEYLDSHSYSVGVPEPNCDIIPEACMIVIFSSTPKALDGEVMLAVEMRSDYKYCWGLIVGKDKERIERPGIDKLSKEESHALLKKASQPIKKSEKAKT